MTRRRTLLPALPLTALASLGGCAGLPAMGPPGEADPPPASSRTARPIPPTDATRDRRADFASVFAQALRGSQQASDWLHPPPTPSTDAAEPRTMDPRRASACSVLIVPGLFNDCLGAHAQPFANARGYADFADLGLAGLRCVALPGRGSVAHNGALLAEALLLEAARPGVEELLLIGYSKGVPDALQALARLQGSGRLPSQRLGLVSVAGAVWGTPLADRFAEWYDWLSPAALLLGCSAADGPELDDLRPGARARWWATHALPPRLACYSVTASRALPRLPPALRPFGRLLAERNPRNDGQLIADDALLPHGEWLAEVRADHWGVALDMDGHPNPLVRAGAVQSPPFPREALLRALLQWVLGR